MGEIPNSPQPMSGNPKTIGVISDTHGLLRPEALDALQGSDLIIHAGDVGDPKIIGALKTLAPIFAVRGNVDTESWALALPETEIVETGLATIYVLHGRSHARPRSGGLRFSHRCQRTLSQTRPKRCIKAFFYINPGSAGPRRFDLPVTVARLHLDQPPWKVEISLICL